jgi:tetratricopeptide (TPR) repeat protein
MRTAACVLSILVLSSSISFSQTSVYRLDTDVDRANAHYRAGWEAFRVEDWDLAAKEFQQAIDIKPKFRLAYYGLGRSFMGLKRFSDAVKVYETCRGLYASEAADKFRDAQEADSIRQEDLTALRQAINTLNDRAANQPNPVQAQNQIRQMRDQVRRIQQKRDEINNNMDIVSEVPAFVSLALGSAYFRSTRFVDAEKAYKETITEDPKAGEAWNNLAALYLITDRIDEADKAVASAEKVGYNVSPGLKADIKKRRNGGGTPNSPTPNVSTPQLLTSPLHKVDRSQL